MNQHAFKVFIILPETRIAFCLTSKCAGTAIIQALLQYYEAEAERPFHQNSCFAWMSLGQVNRFVPKYRRAMFVRNPFDRLVGCYEYHIKHKRVMASQNLRSLGFHVSMSFNQFMEVVLRDPEADPHYCVQSAQTDRLDFLGRFEHLQGGWSDFRRWSGMNLPDLEVANRIPGDQRPHYREYFSKDLRKRVELAYAADLEVYDYAF